jgi:tetratricopeptide (TPR) repeat protein
MDRSGRPAIELLVGEAGRLYDQNRYDEALRAAERAVKGARRMGDLGLEIRAISQQARALQIRGDYAAALRDFSWILGVANDPARREEIERAGVDYQIVDAYQTWVSAARRLPELPTAQLLGVLDSGDAYVRRIGRPGWRAGLLDQRAKVFLALGRITEAIGCAEEALASRLLEGRAAPAPTPGSHRWALGDLLCRAQRHSDAAIQYQAILDDPASTLHEYSTAHRGLAMCAIKAGDTAAAVVHAKEAVRLAAGMGDNVLDDAFASLIQAHRAAGDLPAARAAADRRLDGARRLGSCLCLYAALRSAAEVALDERDAARAGPLLDEAEPLAEALDRQRGGTAIRDEIAQRRHRLDALAPAPDR